MKVRTIRRITVFIFILFLTALVYSAVKYFANQPPLAEIQMAMETLSKAKNKSAGKYASEKLMMAENYYKQTLSEWKIQNSKFFVFRDYDRTKELAMKSFAFAGEAGTEAGNVQVKLRSNIETKLNETNQKIERFEKLYKQLPIERAALDMYNKGSMSYLEAVHQFEKNDLKSALKSAYKAHELLTQAEKSAQVKIVGFFSDYPKWQRNISYAYNLSKSGETVVLIDKMGGTCKLLKDGKEIKTYQAEFGINWMGNKLTRGDRATPEGIYRIIEKKYAPKTKYYKALLLNYPNDEDRARYYEAIRSGTLSKLNPIGGLIEIHGTGGKGINWTEGCIALENRNMDSIFEYCQVNTPVIIVGASKRMEEYIN